MKLFFIIYISLLSACSSPSKHADANAQSYHIRFQPPSNCKYVYTVESSMNTVAEYEDAKRSHAESVNIQLITAFSPGSAGQYNVEFTYNKLISTTDINGQKKTIDAATVATSGAPEDKMFAAFNNAKVSAVVDDKGKLLSVSGHEELINKMLAYLPNDPEGRKSVEETIRSQLGEQFVKNTLWQCFAALPDSALRIGSTWQVVDTLVAETKVITKSTYKLESVNNNIAEISIQSTVSTGGQVANQSHIEVELSGKQEGSLKIDLATGLIVESSSTLNAKGKWKMISTEIPITVKNTNIVHGKKL